MDYRETIDYLYSSLPLYQRVGAAAYKSGLDNTIALDNYFGRPHKRYRTIHIAGTNGKGSVSHMLASVMAAARLKCGLYTSPHLRDFRERIKVNGTPVEEDYVVSFVAEHKEILERIKPSFFEMTAAMAFDYFSRADVDIAIIETGMGGRLDSTNIVTPIISVITNIALDHTAFLGPDRLSIAAEKAGIIKQGVPVVIGESDPETNPLFVRIAFEKEARVSFADRFFRASVTADADSPETSRLTVMRGDKLVIDAIPFPLQGKYQERNVQTVMEVLESLAGELGITTNHISEGLTEVITNTSLEGRWQVIHRKPMVILDTAHNEAGLRSTLAQLHEIPKTGRLRFVIGFVNDKDVTGLLKLFPRSAAYYFTRSSVPRSMPADELASFALSAHLKGNTFGSVAEAYRTAMEEASPGDIIYVGGSTYVVADLLTSGKQ
ncbi:MAG: bifunctional folylpolyglutamate synthase/dihydrofolate synthase [Bacteroidales bacterium]|nr:bifunctional folylpolyglutamate synthase/dihydrofolate synthase [Bacteroidales bacterium]